VGVLYLCVLCQDLRATCQKSKIYSVKAIGNLYSFPFEDWPLFFKFKNIDAQRNEAIFNNLIIKLYKYKIGFLKGDRVTLGLFFFSRKPSGIKHYKVHPVGRKSSIKLLIGIIGAQRGALAVCMYTLHPVSF